MAAAPRPFCPSYEPSLAELIENIRRNLEITASISSRSFNLNDSQIRRQPVGTVGRASPMRQQSRGQSPQFLTPQSAEESLRNLHCEEAVLQAAAILLSRQHELLVDDQNRGTCSANSEFRPICHGSQMSPGNYPMMRPINNLFGFAGSPFPNSCHQDLLSLELTAACCTNVYGLSHRGSRTPSEIASDDTYDIVEKADDFDQDLDAWSVASDP